MKGSALEVAFKSVLRRMEYRVRRMNRAESPRGETKYPGIGAAAKAAGVSRAHMFKVLEGDRSSPNRDRFMAVLKSVNEEIGS